MSREGNETGDSRPVRGLDVESQAGCLEEGSREEATVSSLADWLGSGQKER